MLAVAQAGMLGLNTSRFEFGITKDGVGSPAERFAVEFIAAALVETVALFSSGKLCCGPVWGHASFYAQLGGISDELAAEHQGSTTPACARSSAR